MLVLTLIVWVFDRRHLRFEHVHGYYVDEHDPAGTVQDILFVPDEGDRADTLTLKFPPKIRSIFLLNMLSSIQSYNNSAHLSG